ncbi:DMT family transporter [Natronococcus occultus]|uniref:DMT(Drug/metabolite transporter) superfamily permease n=1 Tax=Natronococcus occultus SP4 TaxID=694430 RepID=L0JX61_9EURY|nr:DMT family transporter [Natronococcus occultus]AGB36704.1 DMT(drug/metabolite transporter) superfamily permease [Natronococcus occultus SP4]
MTSWQDTARKIRGSIPFVSKHTRAVLEALFVTLLWSSSYVLIKIGLEEIPALTFAGLRYGIAAVVLFPLFLHNGGYQSVRRLNRRDFGVLLILGLFMYAVTQGAQFVALQYLKAATVSLFLTFTPVIVAIFSIPLLGERASRRQWAWMGILFIGVVIYFYPFDFGTFVLIGLGIMAVGLLSNSLASILGRDANRDGTLSAVAVTTVSMGFGSAILLGTGVAVQGLPPLSLQSWFIVLWLAVINTAFAFTLWNRTLQTLSATESSVINNTMLAQVAILGWVFLDETLSLTDIIGLTVVMIAALLFQLARKG